MKKYGEKTKFDLAIIAGSAGSLQVVLEILPELHYPLDYALLLIFHRKGGLTDLSLIQLLQSKSQALVKEVEDKEMILSGQIYVAPADYHLLIETDKSFSLDVSEKVNFSRPSIDISLSTAAEVFKEKATAILLSGANSDGIAGMLKLQNLGGYCIAQDPSTAQVDYMPAQAIEKSAVHQVLTPPKIMAFLNDNQ